MPLRHIPLDQIREVDFKNLIENKVPEANTFDCNRSAQGNGDSANTIGGDILFGLDETDGLPTAIVPLVGDMDAEVRRLACIALSGRRTATPSPLDAAPRHRS